MIEHGIPGVEEVEDEEGRPRAVDWIRIRCRVDTVGARQIVVGPPTSHLWYAPNTESPPPKKNL